VVVVVEGAVVIDDVGGEVVVIDDDPIETEASNLPPTVTASNVPPKAFIPAPAVELDSALKNRYSGLP
jgi:hypothetical protein